MFAFAIPFEKLRWYLPGADPRSCLFNGFAVGGDLGWKTLAMPFWGELTKFGVTTARFCQEALPIRSSASLRENATERDSCGVSAVETQLAASHLAAETRQAASLRFLCGREP